MAFWFLGFLGVIWLLGVLGVFGNFEGINTIQGGLYGRGELSKGAYTKEVNNYIE